MPQRTILAEARLELLIWGGAAATLVGVAALIWCIVAALRARRAELSDAELRKQLQHMLPVNLGALFLSAAGLILVVVGVLFS